jgi:AraC-like DNA-binding protein
VFLEVLVKVESSAAFLRGDPVPTPRITYSGYVTTDDTWRSAPLPTDISRLYFVEAGSGVLLSHEGRMPLRPGHAYLAPCGLPCGFLGTDSVTKLFFHLSLPYRGRDAFEGCGRFLELPFPAEDIRTLTAWYFSDDETDQLRLRTAVLHTVCRFLEAGSCVPRTRRALSEPVERALELLRAGVQANTTVRSIAAACYASPALLSRRFKDEMGVSLSAYIERQIMHEASRLLLQSKLTVGEVSERLGFCDQFYFSRRFSAFFGISPREFRKNKTYT